MDKNLQNMLLNLEPTIDKKCYELKQKEREIHMQRIFVLVVLLLLLYQVH